MAHLAWLQRRNISVIERFERLGGALAAEHELAHVADVEQPGAVARPQMFGHDAVILDRHVIAGEFDHARAARAVPGVKRPRFDPRLFVNFSNLAHIGLPSLTWPEAARCRRLAIDPERVVWAKRG